METFIKAKLEQDGVSIPDDDGFAKQYPNLWDWLTVQKVGKWAKDAARLTLAVQGSTWKASLSDESLGQSCTVVGVTMLDALRRLDAACVDPETAWSTWKAGRRGLREVETAKK
jgi:hypothetical protein